MPGSHDARYKFLFSHPGFVRRLLTSFVDHPFVHTLDFDAAERVNTSFVTRRFRSREADIIWKLPFTSRRAPSSLGAPASRRAPSSRGAPADIHVQHPHSDQSTLRPEPPPAESATGDHNHGHGHAHAHAHAHAHDHDQAHDQAVYLYLLIEFQSTVDHLMPLRFLRYITEFYQTLVQEVPSAATRPFPAVFPLLLYNGDARWTAARSMQELIHASIPRRYIPQFSYYPVLINEIPSDTLRRVHNAVSAVFYAEQNLPPDAPNMAILDSHVQELVSILKEEMPDIRGHFIAWMDNYLSGSPLDPDHARHITGTQEVTAMFETRLKAYGEKIAAQAREEAWAQAREEGLEEGLNQGKTEGKRDERRSLILRMHQRGHTVEEIADYTGLSTEEIAEFVETSKPEVSPDGTS